MSVPGELPESDWWQVDFNVEPCTSISPDSQWDCKLGAGHRTAHRNTGGIGVLTKQWWGPND